jgi:type II secretory pathway predicted ATPase ExeA
MDVAHFGLRRRPFPATPDAGSYYPATGHEAVLARLLAGLADGEGVLLVTGQPGTGKTLLCHCLLDRLPAGTTTAFLTNCHLRDRAALLQAILFDLPLPYEGRTEQETRLALTEHLLANLSQNRSTILLVDEAHHLSADLLEELRLLGNVESRAGKALQVILLGQPTLADHLQSPELFALRQRLVVRLELETLPLQEAADYLLHHIRAAGGRPEAVIDEEALEVLARGSRGVPRLLNQAANQAFTLAAQAGVGRVDVEAALEALAMLGLDMENDAIAGKLGDPAAEDAGENQGNLLRIAAQEA